MASGVADLLIAAVKMAGNLGLIVGVNLITSGVVIIIVALKAREVVESAAKSRGLIGNPRKIRGPPDDVRSLATERVSPYQIRTLSLGAK